MYTTSNSFFKLRTLLLLLILLQFTCSQAQDTTRTKKLSFAPAVGINTTWLYNHHMKDTLSSEFENSILPAGDVGMFVIYSPWQFLEVSAGLFYSLKGASDTYYEDDEFNQERLLMHYLEAPLIADLIFLKSFFVGAGCAASYKFSDNGQGDELGNSLHFFDFTLIGNLGWKSDKWKIGLVYKTGTITLLRVISTNIYSRTVDDPNYNVLELYNQSAGIRVAYRL